MLTLLSPAKSLNFDPINQSFENNIPRLHKETQTLIEQLKLLSPDDIKALMHVSDNIAQLNFDRFQSFQKKYKKPQAKESLFAFTGDVYVGLDALSLKPQEIEEAENHVRILSGLYGLLKPLDLIQPYRLEMGTKIDLKGGHRNLYQFWDDKITTLLNQDIEERDHQYVINLASQEYFKSIKRKKVKVPIIDISFLDQKNGKYKTVAFYAKKARGLMTRFIIKNKIHELEDLKSFNSAGYFFDEATSNQQKFVFKREEMSMF